MAQVDGIELNADVLQHFHALNMIGDRHMEALLEGASIARLSKNQVLFRRSPDPTVSYFLLNGEIEVRESFENRNSVESGGAQARFAIEELAKNGATVRAIGDSVVLLLLRDSIDRVMASSENDGFDVMLVSDSDERLEEARFDDEYSEDWMVRLLESPLMTHLSATNIQRCFIELERVKVDEGETLVEAGSRGDYFYILLNGEARVYTEESGPYKGQTFDLVPGDYFGEEALVADTIRNATVKMISRGEIGRLDKAQFDAIFKSSLVQHIDLEKALSFLASAGIQHEIFDVRFPMEYKLGHRDGTVNMPVVSLRKRLRELERTRTYLVTPEGGRRSELAVYLLRQAGLTAYLLNA